MYLIVSSHFIRNEMKTTIVLFKILVTSCFLIYLLHGETLLTIGKIVLPPMQVGINGSSFFMDYDMRDVREYYYKNRHFCDLREDDEISLLLVIHSPTLSPVSISRIQNVLGKDVWNPEIADSVILNEKHWTKCPDRYLFLTSISKKDIDNPLEIFVSCGEGENVWHPAKPLEWRKIETEGNVLEISLMKNGLYETSIRQMNVTERYVMVLMSMADILKEKT